MKFTLNDCYVTISKWLTAPFNKRFNFNNNKFMDLTAITPHLFVQTITAT